MASSNRHWPSMFKSKPCNSHSHSHHHHPHPHQWQHDINSPLMSPASCHRSPYTSVAGSEERSPEPKPRWNPKPEQIRILEAIFNSGMVNPPRDEIRKIRAQLQEYGQVGDANVFYWFQNRKSRSKHKLRLLQNSKNQTPSSQTTAPSSSSSSSSEKSSPKDITPSKGFSIGFSNVTDVIPNSPTASVNQTYFQTHNETTLAPSAEHFFFPLHHHNGGSGGVANAITQGFSFSELSNVVQSQAQAPDHQQNVGSYNSLLLSEIMNHEASKKDQEKAMKMHQHPHLSFCVSSTPITDDSTVPPISTTTVTVPSPLTQIQGVVEAGACGGTAKSTVFINDVAFEVGVGPFDVRAAFGDDVVLVHASGQPVLTNEWGVTLQSLQHGAFYYLI